VLAEQQFQSFDLTLPLQQLLVSRNPFLVFGQSSACSALDRAGSDPEVSGANMSAVCQ